MGTMMGQAVRGGFANAASARSGAAPGGAPREFLCFVAGGQLFGLDVAAVREIRACSPMARMPGAPPYIAGLARVRGAILPVIDLAVRLGWPSMTTREHQAIIVVLIGGQSFGLIVEAVDALVGVEGELLRLPPSLGDAAVTSLIEGVAPFGDRMVLVLNLAGMVDASGPDGYPREAG